MFNSSLSFRNRHLYSLVFLFLWISQACANPIHNEYQQEIKNYEKAISSNKYEQAYKISEELLSMDPSDTLSLLRLVYSSKMLNKKNNVLIDEYLHRADRSTAQNEELISLIQAIQASKTNK